MYSVIFWDVQQIGTKSWRNAEKQAAELERNTEYIYRLDQIGVECTIFAHKAQWQNEENMLPETFAAETCFPVGETCIRSKCFWQHVSSFCKGLKLKSRDEQVRGILPCRPKSLTARIS